MGYVKHNAIAGRSFASWGSLEAHLHGIVSNLKDRLGDAETNGVLPLLAPDDIEQLLRPLAEYEQVTGGGW